MNKARTTLGTDGALMRGGSPIGRASGADRHSAARIRPRGRRDNGNDSHAGPLELGGAG